MKAAHLILVVAGMLQGAYIQSSELSDSFQSVIPSSVEIEVQRKTVGDKVGYSPNLRDGTHAVPSQRSRFEENATSMMWSYGDWLSIDGSFKRRRFVTLRDDFQFDASSIGVQYRMSSSSITDTYLTFDISSNRADTLQKNSYTTIGNNVIKGVSVLSPKDLQWDIGLKKKYRLGSTTLLSMSGAMGRTNSSHSGIQGEIAQGNCNYSFDFGNSGGEVSQLGRCGSLLEVTRIYPTDASVENEFNVSPVLDFQNESYFYRIGATALKEWGDWGFSTEFYYQRYFRSSLDQRITAAGGQAHRSAYSFVSSIGYNINANLSLTAMAEYHNHRYLNQVPVLYTRITSSRFDEDAIFLSLSAKYKFYL